MAVFIEPMILRPDLVVCGTNPVGLALSRLARAGQRIVSVIQFSDGVREALHGWKIPCNGD